MDITASEWNHYIHNIQPSNYLQRLSCPSLMLYGEYDTQVEPNENINKIESINSAYKTAIETDIIKNANHLFQYIEDKQNLNYGELVQDYIQNKNGIMESVLEQITVWLKEKTATA